MVSACNIALRIASAVASITAANMASTYGRANVSTVNAMGVMAPGPWSGRPCAAVEKAIIRSPE